ncbi:hypothetical protein [Lactovum miscens]|uniref:Integrase n=1 Tax=Lactovum miscens TaxID=190387 RepID=A0A841C7L8_9LACT|nr:hypothetical protein [Lactovum miscens]MBB5888344.1 hypothetical protein [Lactovum miscens]
MCLLVEMDVQVKSNVTRVGHKTTTEIYSYITPKMTNDLVDKLNGLIAIYVGQ